ncbi:MAG: hypothetical protein NTX01_00865 [Candidatus Omnitrophica bacterium]|nr:hypothetical protein [Candidatus Omnitrophota bacterium]
MIKGTGWITQKKYGCQKQRWQQEYSDLKSLYSRLRPEIFSYPVANFFRFDTVSKLTTVSIALALFDAKIGYCPGKKQDISILGTNSSGALEANLTYFNDYIANGRTLARGNLFIYTLPSSPLAEAAIHFGLTGKLLYLGFAKNTEKESLKYALNMFKTETHKTIILVNADSKTATAYILQR